jgi:hypothetical protein
MSTALSPSRVSIIWLVSNLLAAGAFLLVASRTWIEPELAHVPGASGGAGVVWFMTAVPVFVIATLLNLAVFAWCCIARLRRRAWPVTWPSWLVVLVWAAALVFDNSRHGALYLPTDRSEK